MHELSILLLQASVLLHRCVHSLHSLIPKHAVSTLMVGSKKSKSPQAPAKSYFNGFRYLWGRTSGRHLKLTVDQQQPSHTERNSH